MDQTTFTDHGTYIIMLAAAKNHLSILPEEKTMVHFSNEIAQAGYSASSCIIQNSMNWTS
ncbi:hypothetical protein [Bacillus sp. FSL W8-0102]|uniref:hypothetical protein n=1 Tax=unclassified Bacillus (in: firmicutes) TaxID=185979 RepID=UPI00403FD635